MAVPILRPYQEHDADLLRTEFDRYNAGILCQPTGSGKGTLAAWLVHRVIENGRKVLFTVYGQPLVEDQYNRVIALGVEAGMIMGSGKAATRRPDLPAQVASISTLHKWEKLPDAKLVIVDECQDSLRPSYRKVLDRYLEMGAKILGLSATPVGPNGKGLGKDVGGIFEFMVIGPSVRELIRDQYLVPCRLYCFDAESLKGIKKRNGDYDQSALSALMAANADRVGHIVDNWKQYAAGRKTVCFGVDKTDATRIKEHFSINGINATTVFDDTSPDERRAIWRDFDHGDLQVISSVAVVGRGWDHSIAKCVIDAAPTLSVQRALQRWGRGSRPHAGCDDFVLLDMAGNYYRHGRYEADRNWNLEGKPIKASNDGEPDVRIKTCPKCRLTFQAGPQWCPRCGCLLPVAPGRKVREADGHLVFIGDEYEEVPEEETLIDDEYEREQLEEALIQARYDKYEQDNAKEEEAKEKHDKQRDEAVRLWASRTTQEERIAKFQEWKITAQKRGYKPGWAYHMYRDLFNCDPPKLPPPPSDINWGSP